MKKLKSKTGLILAVIYLLFSVAIFAYAVFICGPARDYDLSCGIIGFLPGLPWVLKFPPGPQWYAASLLINAALIYIFPVVVQMIFIRLKRYKKGL